MRTLVAAAALILCVPAAFPAVRPAELREAGGQVRALEVRLTELHRRFDDMDRALLRSSLQVLHADAVLSRLPPESPEAREAQAQVRGVLEEAQKEAPLLLEMTVISRRLQVYRRTGELPEGIEDLSQVRRLLETPWEGVRVDPSRERPEAPISEKELTSLMRQLLRYDELSGLPPRTEAALVLRVPAGPRTEGTRSLSGPLAPPVRERGPAPSAALEAPAARGKAAYDPLPGLLEMLSSPHARTRALAADELGQRGASAASALPSLKGLLRDADPGVRSSAALALGGIGGLGPELLAELRGTLNDPHPDVRFSARASLRRLGLRP